VFPAGDRLSVPWVPIECRCMGSVGPHTSIFNGYRQRQSTKGWHYHVLRADPDPALLPEVQEVRHRPSSPADPVGGNRTGACSENRSGRRHFLK
jgi:hypothetical protein